MVSTLVINGLGRCGTTLVYEFIQRYMPCIDFIDSISLLNPRSGPGVTKTHDPYPQKSYPANIRVVYMYGNPMDTVLSFEPGSSNIYGRMHGDIKLGVNWEAYKGKAFTQDVYDLTDHLDRWITAEISYPLLYLRYETLYDHLPELIQFAGLPSSIVSSFPAQRPRKTDWTKCSTADQGKLYSTYRSLEEKIRLMPDCELK